MQVWRESRLVMNSGNRAGLIKQIPDRCGGKIRLVRKPEGATEQWRKKEKRHTKKTTYNKTKITNSNPLITPSPLVQ